MKIKGLTKAVLISAALAIGAGGLNGCITVANQMPRFMQPEYARRSYDAKRDRVAQIRFENLNKKILPGAVWRDNKGNLFLRDKEGNWTYNGGKVSPTANKDYQIRKWSSYYGNPILNP